MRLTTVWIIAMATNVVSVALNSVGAVASVVDGRLLWLLVALVCLAVNAVCLSHLITRRPEEYR